MKKIEVYLDTSVIGGCYDEEFKQYSTKLIEEIRNDIKIGVISEITIEELENAPEKVKNIYKTIADKLRILKVNQEVSRLAQEYLKAEVIGRKNLEDAVHIALATVYQIDVLVSWNFRHIVNYNKIKGFNAENIKNGYKQIEIYSPMEVIDFEKN
jgi:predicted nucleic acid-binding protein